MSNYGYTKKVAGIFEDIVQKTIEGLKIEKFGILSDIDVTATLKQKLDVEVNNYRILGACNPPRAYQALQLEEEIGLLLPCNVIIYENSQGVFVSAIKPSVAFSIVENKALEHLAGEVEEIMKRIIDKL